ncbi:MAG: HD domain-containing phosphohydrolase [Campylobacterales bacterium]
MGKIIRLPFKIRPTVLVLFTFIGVFMTLTTLGMLFYFSKTQATDSASTMFENLSSTLEEKVESFDMQGKNIAKIILQIDGADALPSEDSKHPLLNLFATILQDSDYLYALYTGYSNGDFYELINLEIDPELRSRYSSSSDERWLVIKIFEKDGRRERLELFLDSNLKIKRAVKKDATYDPRARPWYKKAKEEKRVIKTAPYRFSNIDQRGVTYAKESKSGEFVVGVDVVLGSLDEFIKRQSFNLDEHIFLYDDKKNIIATNTQSSDEFFKKAFGDGGVQGIKSIDNESYFIFRSNIENSDGEYLGVVAPMDTLLAPYYKNLYYSFIFTMFMAFLIAMPIIYYASNLVTRPIQKISRENEYIRRREFDKVKPVETNIVEIKELSDSLVSMSKDIQAYEEAQKELMDSFIRLLGSAIDAKSAYTGGHNKRVAELATLIAQKASDSKDGVFEKFTLSSEDERREIEIAAWLHDCGKIVMPEYIVDKATKLETIYNRIHEVRLRFEVLYRDAIITALKSVLSGDITKETAEYYIESRLETLRDEFAFVAECNVGGEFMSEESKQKLQEIAKQEWTRYFDNSIGLSHEESERLKEVAPPPAKEKLLDDRSEHIIERVGFSEEEYERFGFKIRPPKHLYNLGEIYNLSISRGTLSEEDRFKINEHSIMTIKMLSQLPFPEALKRVPEFAGSHHETLIGTGYPRGLTKEQMSLPARIMAVADVFEALTASDRPYKKPKTLSEAIKILSFMVKDKHIDEDVFKLFLSSGAYLEFGREYLNEEQIDEVDVESYVSIQIVY